ncbi:DUF4296 domain-containing protein [Capnocytophaga catalasegens]|uniref:Lipoprotein n=1 Tax=Capnocytophaga catalasegens TaxID=1004260 RepID=A0AAV5AWU2_9FLAO|nr:DUF4296 domain-containing protein [Capnocytophaga catalasegens]GIZ15436.1 lipoprotein precursor [Capnocytophaga catalasegens]GJM51024.1 lipoprotein precursor [Capnocytophaga catalasegens]GJM52209.1 lipoprotein precursor [Capnocytophaga catalasegens]
MKYNWLYIIVLALFSCGQNVIEKPQKFIPKEKMEQILYDLAILNAAKSVDAHIFDNHFVDVNEILYKTNGIDSLQLVENMIYYASHPNIYSKIIDNVQLRLKKEDSLAQKKDTLKLEKLPTIEK